ncbi:MAG: hypothetical protein JWQ43_1986 [Glaciihabitans sp.]|nr:hypothetical protein [Glaciihabitans sp.]
MTKLRRYDPVQVCERPVRKNYFQPAAIQQLAHASPLVPGRCCGACPSTSSPIRTKIVDDSSRSTRMRACNLIYAGRTPGRPQDTAWPSGVIWGGLSAQTCGWDRDLAIQTVGETGQAMPDFLAVRPPAPDTKKPRKHRVSGAFDLVASEGFEPPNAMQSDLQSDPFGHLGNSPERFRPRVIT